MSRAIWRYKIHLALGLIVAAVAWMAASSYTTNVAAACSPIGDDKGAITTTIDVAETGDYRVWSRILVPDSTNNSYYLEVDDTYCGIVVGDRNITANEWTWIDYKDGSSSSKITLNLSAGTHTVRMIGRESGVEIDRVMFLDDQSCVPTGTGENCVTSADATPPVVSVTSPTGGATVSGTVALTANATDGESNIQKVEFMVDGNLVGVPDTSPPYSVQWSSSSVVNGSHTISAKAYNDAGLTATSSSVSVTVSNQSDDPDDPDPTYLDEDINQDGRVNLQDFSLLAGKFGQTSGSLGRTDINGDGRVNLQDFSLLAGKFGHVD